MPQGYVSFVGAGPGDPSLITVRGLHAIQRADVIVYDRLASPQLLQYARPDATLVYCGKEAHHHQMKQEEIHARLIAEALQGRVVVRLKGGDPSVFGRVGEEAMACHAHGIPFDIIAGVTAGIAACAYTGIPLTHRDHNASFVTVTGNRCSPHTPVDWAQYAAIDTIVIYMGVANVAYIEEQLLLHGKVADTPVAFIEWATTPRQRTVIATVGTMCEVAKQAVVQSPAIMVVGAVVSFTHTLNWFERQPLRHLKIISLAWHPPQHAFALPAFAPKSITLLASYAQNGASIFQNDVFLPIPSAYAQLYHQMCVRTTPFILLFHSVWAVEFWWQCMQKYQIDVRRLPITLGVCDALAAARLTQWGLHADHVFPITAQAGVSALQRMDSLRMIVLHHGGAFAALCETLPQATMIQCATFHAPCVDDPLPRDAFVERVHTHEQTAYFVDDIHVIDALGTSDFNITQCTLFCAGIDVYAAAQRYPFGNIVLEDIHA